MAVRVAINGFGRIGRLAFRQMPNRRASKTCRGYALDWQLGSGGTTGDSTASVSRPGSIRRPISITSILRPATESHIW